MFNLLTLGFGILTVVTLSRINKSNKLFWTLLVSMLIGFAGGSIVGKFNSVGKKKVGTTYVTPTHESTPLTADSLALVDDVLVAFSTNHVSQSYINRDMVPTDRALLALNPEDDIGKVDTENTS